MSDNEIVNWLAQIFPELIVACSDIYRVKSKTFLRVFLKEIKIYIEETEKMLTTIKQRVIFNGLISELFKKMDNRLQVTIQAASIQIWLCLEREYKLNVLVNFLCRENKQLNHSVSSVLRGLKSFPSERKLCFYTKTWYL